MKIVYLIPNCNVSGGVAVICQHANRLLERGHEVFLVPEYGEGKIDWFPNQNVPILLMRNYPDGVDILVATAWSTTFKAVKLHAKHKFYFVQSDETRFFEQNSIYQHLAALTYVLNFNYLTEAKWIKKWLFKDFGHKAELIPNGLDPKIFFPDIPIAKKGEKPRILLEGAIDLPYKGMKEAFQVVDNLDVEVWCVSSLGKPKPNWHCDRFFEQIPITKMRNIYSSCDILLKLSRVEGFFGPPLEMMACGGTTVVGKVSGYDEYIVDEYNSLVVEPQDIEGARNAIKKIINDPYFKEKLITNGLITASKWNWDKSIDKLENYYLNILQKKIKRQFSKHQVMVNNAIASSYDQKLNLDRYKQYIQAFNLSEIDENVTNNSNSSSDNKKILLKDKSSKENLKREKDKDSLLRKIINKFKLLKNYLIIKKTNYFDVKHYLLENPDVRLADIDPIIHYLEFGWKEGRDPSEDFSNDFYLSIHQDVRTSKENPLIHYILFGKTEKRIYSNKKIVKEESSQTKKEPRGMLENPKNSNVSSGMNSSNISMVQRKNNIDGERSNLDKHIVDQYFRNNRFRIAFIGQPEYFSFAYKNAFGDSCETREFRFEFSATDSDFQNLLEYNADYYIFFRGEHFPENLLRKLPGKKINLSSEIFPKIINGKLSYTQDSFKRYQNFRKITEKSFDYVFHYDSTSLEFLNSQGIHLSGEFVFPVATNIYHPMNIEKKWDLFFIGRSTRHRESLFGQLKHSYNFLHIAHGIWGEELVKMINQSKICLNIHSEDEISWEPRIQMLLSCGAFVISEPISRNEYLRPGIDFIELSQKNMLQDLVIYYLENKSQREKVANRGQNRVHKLLNNNLIFKKLIMDIELHKYQKFHFDREVDQIL